MKTTAVAVSIDDENIYVGHVGDSRAYIFHRNRVRTRTLDHSIPQMLVLSGEIKEQDIRNHPDRSRLLRVLGIEWETPMYEIMHPISINKCQSILLCSDGFWEHIDEAIICKLLKNSGTVQEWLDSMVSVVQTNGAGKNMDNYSAIAVWCV